MSEIYRGPVKLANNIEGFGGEAHIGSILPSAFGHHSGDVVRQLIGNIVSARNPGSGPVSLDYRLSDIATPHSLTDIDKAAEMLFESIEKRRPIYVVCDYDVDGTTSAAVLIRYMRDLGVKLPVHAVIPNRHVHGYGLTRPLVEDMESRTWRLHDPNGDTFGQDDDPFSSDPTSALSPTGEVVVGEDGWATVVTVDNGISAHDGVKAMNERFGGKCRMIVTDHHLPPSDGVLPQADAIVNPNRDGDAFPNKGLCGCGVIFYTLWRLRELLDERGWLEANGVDKNTFSMIRYLDLVSLATVADVAPLDQYDNRVLAQKGLDLMNKGRINPLIGALLSDREGVYTSSDHGFGVGPRINAAGRLHDAILVVWGLVCDDPARVNEIAASLANRNTDRKQRQTAAAQAVQKHLLSSMGDSKKPLAAVVSDTEIEPGDLPDEGINEGVVGLVASEVVRLLGIPSFVFTVKKDDPETLKGSGRSVPGVNIKDALDSVHRHPEFRDVMHYGGHAAAAGVSIPANMLGQFRERLCEELRRQLGLGPDAGGDDAYQSTVSCDAVVESGVLLGPIADACEHQPWGARFESPKFLARVKIITCRVSPHKFGGDPHLLMNVQFPDGSRADAVAFSLDDTDNPGTMTPDRVPYAPGQDIDITFTVQNNYFRGRKRPQIMVNSLSPPGMRFEISGPTSGEEANPAPEPGQFGASGGAVADRIIPGVPQRGGRRQGAPGGDSGDIPSP